MGDAAERRCGLFGSGKPEAEALEATDGEHGLKVMGDDCGRISSGR